MSEQGSMEEAIGKFVESLEEEQKSNRLIESKQKIKLPEEDDEEDNIEEETEYEKSFSDEEVPEYKEENDKDEDIKKIKNFLEKIITCVSNSEIYEIRYDKEINKIDIYGKDLGIAIGKNGKNMEAIEYLVNLFAKRKNIVERTITIDIKDYRKKKYDIIRNLALRMAKKAVKEGRKIILKPMPSYERKIIHDTLSDNKEVKTKSKNKEPYRRIIIYPNR